MRLAKALAIALAVVSLAAAADPRDQLSDPAQEARARALFQQIRCVVCQSESIDDSEAELARDLRQTVRSEVAAGWSDARIRRFLVQRYGEFILLRPRFSVANAAAWLAPFAIVLGGVGALLLRGRRPDRGASDLTPEEEARLAKLRDS
jgi:cytochrome c-type biogenesis protein CcmH